MIRDLWLEYVLITTKKLVGNNKPIIITFFTKKNQIKSFKFSNWIKGLE